MDEALILLLIGVQRRSFPHWCLKTQVLEDDNTIGGKTKCQICKKEEENCLIGDGSRFLPYNTSCGKLVKMAALADVVLPMKACSGSPQVLGSSLLLWQMRTASAHPLFSSLAASFCLSRETGSLSVGCIYASLFEPCPLPAIYRARLGWFLSR